MQDRLDSVSNAAGEAGEFAQSVLDTIREPQLVLDGELLVVTANKAFLATFGLASVEVVGHSVDEIDLGAWNSSELLDLLRGVLSNDRPLGEHQLSLADKRNGPISINLNALELLQEPGKRRLILLTVTASGGAT
jgi:nitrogen-specific signal transduction histidine kinase